MSLAHEARSPCIGCEREHKDKNRCIPTCEILEAYRANLAGKVHRPLPSRRREAKPQVLICLPGGRGPGIAPKAGKQPPRTGGEGEPGMGPGSPSTATQRALTVEELRRIRLRLGLTQDAFAELVGAKSGSMICHYEKERAYPPEEVARRILEAGDTAPQKILRGADIRTTRRAHGLTQEDFARKLGVHQKTVAYWERDRNTPRGDMLIKIRALADHLGDELESITPEKIRIIRKKNGMTQKKFAALMDVSTTTIRFWEQGRIGLSAENEKKLRDLAEETPGG